MAFFNFLDDVGGFISRAATEATKKRKPGMTPEETANYEREAERRKGMSEADLMGEANQSALKAKETTDRARYAIPEAKAAGLQKRNKLESDVKNLALALVKEHVARKQGLDPNKKESLAFGGLNEEEFTAPIYRQGIGGISRVTRQVLKQLGIQSPPIEQRLRELEDLESQASKAETEAPPIPYAPGSGKLEAASKTVKDAEEALKYAVTDEQRARLEAQRDDAMKLLDPGGKLKEARTAPMPNSQTILGAAEQAGVPERDFQDAIAETAKKMGLDLDKEVEFPLALQRLLNSPEFADLRPDFESIGASGQMGPPASMAPGFEKGEKEAAPAPVDLHAEERQILTKIANEQRWTWYEAIAFILLSMVLKPGATLMLWNRQANIGARKAELVENRRKQRQAQYEQQQAAALAKERRSQAAEMKKALALEGYRQYGQAVDDQRQMRQRWMELIYKTATTRKKAEEDPNLKIMQKDVEMYLDFAAKASANMETKKANEYMQKAENAMNFMLKYRAGELEEAAP